MRVQRGELALSEASEKKMFNQSLEGESVLSVRMRRGDLRAPRQKDGRALLGKD